MRLLLWLVPVVVLAGVLLDAQAPLSPLETLTYENTALKAQLADALAREAALKAEIGTCFARLGPLEQQQNRAALDADIAQMKADFEQARPGFTFDPATKTFTPAPPAPKPEG